MSRRDQLEAAYRATMYCVETPDSRFALRIGQPSAELDRLLANKQESRWAYLTACNPKSNRQSDAENEHAQRQLLKMLTAEGYLLFFGIGIGEAGDWPPEPSVLVVGIDELAAVALGRQFGQAAIVVGRVGESPRLVWCD
jgi:hypothetical protein